MPRSSKWSLFTRFPHQNPITTSPLPYSATHPVHLILLELITQILYIINTATNSVNTYKHGYAAKLSAYT